MERSVANLTTEQLYRKRALDRVNQRASRARKKGRIQELEEEVTDLKQRLARSEEQVKRLESSEASLRQAIESARASLRLIDGSSALPAGIPTPAPSTTAPASASGGRSPILSASSPSIESSQDQVQLIPAPTTTSSWSGGGAAFDLTHEDTGLTLGLPFSADGDSLFNFWQDGFPSDLSSVNAFSLSLDPFPSEGDVTSWVSQTADIQIGDGQEPPPTPLWERTPLHVEATCRIDEVILELVHSNRQREQRTGPIPELNGPSFPSIKSLLNPDQQSVNQSISNTIGQHGRITMTLPRITEKVAAMYLICTYVRWLISPNKQNYEAIPEFMRPIEEQLTTPHPFWIDVIIWPEARLNILQHMDWSEFPKLRELSNASLSVNWPHDTASIFTAKSKSELRLNPLFENHIRQVSNWTWGSSLSVQFPFLKCVPITDEST